jgi:hypothetical protein
VLATGQQAVLLDMNTILWASSEQRALLGGARFSCAATIPIANNSLSSSTQGAISGGGGLGDVYLQPVILGWHHDHADIRAIAGVLAPTGKFNAGANDNVGNGYWTPVIAAGQTFYLAADKATTISLFEMYEFHTTQQGTQIRPGQTFDLDYSVMRAFPIHAESRLQVGVVGYGAWQTTAKTGPGITTAEEAQRYRVNALGVTGSEGDVEPEVLRRILKSVDLSGPLASDLGRGGFLGAPRDSTCGLNKMSKIL